MRVYCITTDCPATKGINTRDVVLVKSLPPDLKYSPVDIINSLVNNVLRGHNPLAKFIPFRGYCLSIFFVKITEQIVIKQLLN